MLKSESDKKKLFLPENTSLPFFTYGIFRPGQIGYESISEFVDETKIRRDKIKGTLKLRDGLIIYDPSGSSDIEGYLLFFKKGFEQAAYERIAKMEPDKFYTWTPNPIRYRDKNILYGKKNDQGIDEIQTSKSNLKNDLDDKKDDFEDKVWDEYFDSIWKDPFIINGFKSLEYFEKLPEFTSHNSNQFKWEEESKFNEFLKYQMLFLFLSTILERISFLNGGFGLEANKRIKEFAKDELLQSILISTFENSDSFSRKITRSDNPDENSSWNYNPNEDFKFQKCILYYYGLRSNITHRGKSGINKFADLKKSYFELKNILQEFWKQKEIIAKNNKLRIDKLINNV